MERTIYVKAGKETLWLVLEHNKQWIWRVIGSCIIQGYLLRNVDKILTSQASSMTQPDFHFIGIILKAICKMIDRMLSGGNVRDDEVQN